MCNMAHERWPSTKAHYTSAKNEWVFFLHRVSSAGSSKCLIASIWMFKTNFSTSCKSNWQDKFRSNSNTPEGKLIGNLKVSTKAALDVNFLSENIVSLRPWIWIIMPGYTLLSVVSPFWNFHNHSSEGRLYWVQKLSFWLAWDIV